MSRLTLISPVDGAILLDRIPATAAEIEAVMSAAQRAQHDWSAVPARQRVAMLERAIERLEAEADDAGAELTLEMGRPTRHASREIATAAARARHMLALVPEAMADQEVATGRIISREPVGVILVVAPWNYPYLTAVNSVVPALAAGNSVVLKHSFQTALSADRLVAALAAELPAGTVQALHSDDGGTLAALRHPATGHVVFTGSVAVGRMLAAEAAHGLKTVTLELGGKDAAYVRADADVEQAVAGLVDGSFFNSGQSCCAVERIYVDRQVYPNFVERFAARSAELVLGDPRDAATTLGPMARRTGAETVRAQIAEGLAAGATPLLPGEPAESSGTYLPAQVLVDVDHTMSVMRDESFGPVVGIMQVSHDDDAIERINDSAFGLTASIWSRDAERAAGLGDRVRVGTVYHNRCDYLDPALPWSGRGDSGMGVSLSRLAYASLTYPKSRLFEPESPPFRAAPEPSVRAATA